MLQVAQKSLAIAYWSSFFLLIHLILQYTQYDIFKDGSATAGNTVKSLNGTFFLGLPQQAKVMMMENFNAI